MKKPIYFITTILLLVIIFAFYWYEWRPSQIRKECYYKVYDKALNLSALGEKAVESQKKENESKYKNCLIEKGLEK